MQALIQIQTATLAARERLNDKAISTQVENGQIQVTRVTYPDGVNSLVEPVSDWMPVADVCSYLNTMQ
ncbi:MAG: hypothetical protein V4858_17120 [Pseudomonadota bacterium]